MARPDRKTELALWWYEYRTRITALTTVILTIFIILAIFYPFSSEIVIGEVRAVTSPDSKIGIQATATIYSPKTGEVVMAVPVGIVLNVGNKVEISRGKTVAGFYRHVFVKKISSQNESSSQTAEAPGSI